jgi:PAS domain-containing protein
MERPDRSTPAGSQVQVRRTPASLVAGALLAVSVVAGSPDTASVAAGPLLVVGVVGRGDLGRLVVWIAGGAVLGGLLLWGLGEVGPLDVAPDLLAGSGIAVGGGLGGVLRLLAVGDRSPDGAETVTFDRSGEEDGAAPEPRPADLFEASPDPIVFFDDSGDGPVVRAVNPAYESVFGVRTAAVDDAALADALKVTDDADAIVAAARDGDGYRDWLECETVDGRAEFAIRLATVSDDRGTRGYVLYTPRSQ